MTIPEFVGKKSKGEKISLLTCYDAIFSSLFQNSAIDALLVGDSVAMAVHGFESTLEATLEMMEFHVASVRRGNPGIMIIADMPFLSFREGKHRAVKAAGRLMRAGAGAVKVEGIAGHENAITHIVGSGIPVMGHLGLTPQSFHQLGGFKVQGRDEKGSHRILVEAQKLQELGCFSLVLECVPEKLAGDIAKKLAIPVIGIGAGRFTDGQVMVLHDLLGLSRGNKARFVRAYLDGAALVREAIDRFSSDIATGSYPSAGEVYQA